MRVTVRVTVTKPTMITLTYLHLIWFPSMHHTLALLWHFGDANSVRADWTTYLHPGLPSPKGCVVLYVTGGNLIKKAGDRSHHG